jgi:uncharacterized membrane protein (UPF0182 family)
MQETLEGALTELFGGTSGPRRPPAPAVATGEAGGGRAITDSAFLALVAEARRRYQAALQANREVDWARYGEEFRRLGEVLERLGAGAGGSMREPER